MLRGCLHNTCQCVGLFSSGFKPKTCTQDSNNTTSDTWTVISKLNLDSLKWTQLISVRPIQVKAEDEIFFVDSSHTWNCASQAGYQQDPSPDPRCQRIHVPISQQVRWFHWRERQRKQRLHSSGGLPTCACERPASLHVCCFFFFLYWGETNSKRQQTFRLKGQNCQNGSRWVSHGQENSIHSEGGISVCSSQESPVLI